MRGSGLARPTRALLTTWSARSLRPRSAGRTPAPSPRSRRGPPAPGRGRGAAAPRPRRPRGRAIRGAPGPVRTPSRLGHEPGEALGDRLRPLLRGDLAQHRGKTASGANATFLVVPSAIPVARSSASRREESKDRITLSTSHRTAPKGGLPLLLSVTRDRDLLVVVQLVHQRLDLRLVPDEVAAGGARRSACSSRCRRRRVTPFIAQNMAARSHRPMSLSTIRVSRPALIVGYSLNGLRTVRRGRHLVASAARNFCWFFVRSQVAAPRRRTGYGRRPGPARRSASACPP